MKWTTTILFLLAMAVVVAVGAMVSRQSTRTPADLFASIDMRMQSGRYDKEQTLANLDIVLDSALSVGDAALCTKIRLARGRLLVSMGAYERARADLSEVLQVRSGDRAIERLMVEIDLRAGDFAAGLARVEDMIAADPAWSEGFALLGDLHKRASTAALEDCLAIFDKTLVSEDADRAKAFVLRAAAWDPDDPRRVELAHDLRPLFGTGDEPKLDAALDAAHRSAAHLADARGVLAKSLGVNFQARSLSSLLELYRRADKADLALDLATSVLRMPEVFQDEATITFVIRELERQGRLRLAAGLATTWLTARHNSSPELLSECCDVLYRTERWRPLSVAASALRSTGDRAAEFYLGLCDLAAGNTRDGRFKLQRYVASDAREPIPKARARAWREIARASRELEETHVEREALEGAVGLDPNGDGTVWLRLARLQYASGRGGLVQPELRWARGMSLLPKQTDALMPIWTDLGDQELASNGVDLDLARAAIAAGRTWTPTEESSPYELWTLARVYLDAGDAERAYAYTRRLLAVVPGFLPGLDLELALAQKLGRVREVVGLFLQRLELVGPDAKSAEILRWLPLDSLLYRDLVRLMRFDPEHAGRFVVARTLAQRGEKRRALSILEKVGAETLGPDAIRLAARLHLDLGEPQAALTALVPIARSLQAPQESLDLFLEAAMACHDHERVEQMAAALAHGGGQRPEDALALADRMLSGGSAAAADVLYAELDLDPNTRSGDVLVRRAAAALTRGDLTSVEALLERANAFDSAGLAELVTLLACIPDDRASDLAGAASTLRFSGFKATPLQSAAIDLIAGRSDAAATAIQAALRADPTQPLWQLLQAAASEIDGQESPLPAYFGANAARETKLFLVGPDGARDPRRALCTLLAIYSPLLRGFARGELGAMPVATHGSLWPGLLGAVLAQSCGEPIVARHAIGNVLAQNPDFGPAWDFVETIPSAAQLEPRAALLARIRRMEALGELSGTLAERLLDEARVLQLKGDVVGALSVVRAAAEEDPTSGAVRWKEGELLRARGELTAAIQAYSQACRALPVGSNAQSTGEFLALLDEASQATPPAIDPREYALELEKLNTVVPDDPRVVVAQARLEQALDPTHPPLALARAYARLDRFRDQHAETSIESLAPGASAQWAELLLAVEPDRAKAFVQRELELDPGALDLWVLLGRVLAAQNDIPGALARFEFVLDLAPDHPVLAEYAWIKSGREMERDETRTLLMRMNTELGPRLSPAQVALIRARASITLGGRGTWLAVESLDSIQPSELDALDAERYRFLFAEALIARGKPEDLIRARTLLDDADSTVRDPFLRDLARALAALASRSVPEEPRAASLR